MKALKILKNYSWFDVGSFVLICVTALLLVFVVVEYGALGQKHEITAQVISKTLKARPRLSDAFQVSVRIDEQVYEVEISKKLFEKIQEGQNVRVEYLTGKFLGNVSNIRIAANSR